MPQLPAEFSPWLLQQKSRIDEVGRIAREAVKDPTFPHTINRLWKFLHYYRLEPINRKAIKKAHSEWRKVRKVSLA